MSEKETKKVIYVVILLLGLGINQFLGPTQEIKKVIYIVIL